MYFSWVHLSEIFMCISLLVNMNDIRSLPHLHNTKIKYIAKPNI